MSSSERRRFDVAATVQREDRERRRGADILSMAISAERWLEADMRCGGSDIGGGESTDEEHE